MKLWLFLMALIVLASCRSKEEKPIMMSIAERKAAMHYDEPIDSIAKHLTFYDSANIAGLNISFHYFMDNRNASEHWRHGVITINRENGNFHVYSQRKPSYFLEVTEEMHLFSIPLIQREYFDSSNIDHLSNFYLKNVAQEQAMEVVLNNMTRRQNNLLDAAYLDSIFHYFFFRPMIAVVEQPFKKRLNKISARSLVDSIDSRIEELNRWLQITPTYQKDIFSYTIECFSRLKTKMMKSTDTASMYIYNCEGACYVVSLNEKFLSDSMAHDYYSTFANEYFYDVRFYEISHLSIFPEVRQ